MTNQNLSTECELRELHTQLSILREQLLSAYPDHPEFDSYDELEDHESTDAFYITLVSHITSIQCSIFTYP